MTNPKIAPWQAVFRTIDESGYTWEKFVDKVTEVFNASDPREADRPVATMQMRYVHANMAVAELLKSTGHLKTAIHFHTIAEALNDVADGVSHPLFKVERPSGKPGRVRDTSDIWRIRASVCLGMEYLIAGGKTPEKAIEFVIQNYRKKLVKLLRTKAKIESSLPTWHKSFEMDDVSNATALSYYKDGMSILKTLKQDRTGTEILKAGEILIENAAERASKITKI